MMKRKDIDKRFTDLVAEYINKGMTISTKSMSGTQGEEGKVDLTDGKKIYRVLLEAKGGFRECDQFVLSVREYDEEETKNASRGWTIWNNKGEEIYCEKFYAIGDRYDERVIYTTNQYYANHCREIMLSRYANRRSYGSWEDYSIESPAKLNTVMKIVRSRKGYKKVTPDMVSVRRWNGKGLGYVIHVEGKKKIEINNM